MKPITPTDEKVLLLRLRDGDERAYMAIYHLYKRRLAGNLLKLLKSDELVDDVLQELFLRLWEHRTSIDPEMPIKGYLFRVAENLVYDIFRKASRDKTMWEYLRSAQTVMYNHVDDHIHDQDNQRILEEAISLLPPQRQKIFRLCRIEGKSHEEVSRILGISTSTINNQMIKANQFLSDFTIAPKHRVIASITITLLLGT